MKYPALVGLVLIVGAASAPGCQCRQACPSGVCPVPPPAAGYSGMPAPIMSAPATANSCGPGCSPGGAGASAIPSSNVPPAILPGPSR
jgi:hypothetical protein